jgi:glycine dehydrogenase
MLAIRSEIDAVADGATAVEASALRHAPHTAEDLLGPWDRPYSPAEAAYPDPKLRGGKYFPPVSRIDGAYGDRNLICTCEPLEA